MLVEASETISQIHLSACPVLPSSRLLYICCFWKFSLKISCSRDSPSELTYWGPTWRHEPIVRKWGSGPTTVFSPTPEERGWAGVPQPPHPVMGTGKETESASASLLTLRPLCSNMWVCWSLSHQEPEPQCPLPSHLYLLLTLLQKRIWWTQPH